MSDEEKGKPEQEEEEHGTISRRRFLRDAGLLLGGSVVGSMSILSACQSAGATTTVTQTQPPITKQAETSTLPVTTTVTAPPVTTTVTTTVQVPKPLTALTVNGTTYNVDIQPHWTLAKVLRETLGLTGTKVNCDIGECGACTVIVNGQNVLSCLILAAEAVGKKIQTIEGLATWSGATPTLHPLQQAFIDVDAIQCGACVPGVIMCAKVLLDANPKPTQQQAMMAISGNLCRCSGYWPYVNAIQLAATRLGKGS